MATVDSYAFYGIIVKDVQFDKATQTHILPDGRILSSDEHSLIPDSLHIRPSNGFSQANLDTVCYDSVSVLREGVCPEIVVGYFLGGGHYNQIGEYSRLEEKALLVAPTKRQQLIKQLRQLNLPFDDADVGPHIFGQQDF